MQATDVFMVYVTMSSPEEARSLAMQMVEQRFAACANIIDNASSIYRWQGKIECSNESLCIFKTTHDRWDALYAALRAAHSYETPCIVALPIIEGDAEYITWIHDCVHNVQEAVG